jgi:hypothetical protein
MNIEQKQSSHFRQKVETSDEVNGQLTQLLLISEQLRRKYQEDYRITISNYENSLN